HRASRRQRRARHRRPPPSPAETFPSRNVSRRRTVGPMPIEVSGDHHDMDVKTRLRRSIAAAGVALFLVTGAVFGARAIGAAPARDAAVTLTTSDQSIESTEPAETEPAETETVEPSGSAEPGETSEPTEAAEPSETADPA